MKKHRKPDSFMKLPIYPGGNTAMAAFIKEHLEYPEEAKKNKVEGMVRLKIDINNKGIVIRTKVIDGIGHGCNEEAQRVAMLFKFDTSRLRGVKVTYHKTVNIHFGLEAPVNPGMQITYTVSSTKKEESGGSYNYSIDLGE